MRISSERLVQFIKLIELKTGKQISEKKALQEAEQLLRIISIVYKPATKADYSLALAEKAFIKS